MDNVYQNVVYLDFSSSSCNNVLADSTSSFTMPVLETDVFYEQNPMDFETILEQQVSKFDKALKELSKL
jgi:hypothetical protein